MPRHACPYHLGGNILAIRRIDPHNGTAIPVSFFLDDNTDRLVVNQIGEILLRFPAERLPPFRGVNTVDPVSDFLSILGKAPKRIAVCNTDNLDLIIVMMPVCRISIVCATLQQEKSERNQ